MKLQLNLPEDWLPTQTAADTKVLTDPQRPTRQLRIIALSNNQPTAPEQMLDRCLVTRIDADTRQTLRQPYPRMVFKSDEHGFSGAEFLGFSDTNDGSGTQEIHEQHLLACLSNDGIGYWLLYLTDTTTQAEDLEQSINKNAAVLRAVYQSARFADD